jgi:hypothetical protein
MVIGVAAAAVALTGFGGVASADNVTPSTNGATITTFPAKAVLIGNKSPAEFVKAQVVVPSGLTCATAMTARVVGQRDAVTVSAVPDCDMVSGSAIWTVTANAITKKREAVVKFIATNPADGSRTVSSLNMKILLTAKPAKPAEPNDKPAATGYSAGAEVTTFPAKTVLLGSPTQQFVTVKLAIPAGLACENLSTRVVGQRNAVMVSTATCVGASATWTVTANAITHKRHAVVKFIVTNPTDSSRTVNSLNVKVNPGAKPAKPAKGQQGQGY